MPEQDLYKILGVSRDADTEEIKKAYRKLAMKYHPDRNPGDTKAEERFKELSVAHGVLSDPEKKKLYDEFGLAGLREGFDPEAARAYASGGGIPRSPGGGGYGPAPGGFEEVDIGDLFEQLFRGFGGRSGFPGFDDFSGGRVSTGPGGFQWSTGGGGAPSFSAVPSRGRDVAVEVQVGFMEAVRGATRTFEVELPGTCEKCGGTGFTAGATKTCGTCGGSGRQSRSSWFGSGQDGCPTCGGTGRVPSTPCNDCSGEGRQTARKTLRVKIPPGASTGSEIRIAGRGEAGIRGGTPGDLVLRLQVAPHPVVEREGRNLVVPVAVTVPEAYSGAKILVRTPWDQVRVTLPEGSRSGQKLRVRGHGVRPRSGERGDLILVLEVQVPDARDDRTREAVEALEGSYGADLRAADPFSD